MTVHGLLCARAITVRFGNRVVLDNVTLTVAADELVCLTGASGSGKSTLLRVIAGLHLPDTGSVCWNGTDIGDQPPHRRRFGMVFQDAGLFPHLDVAGNVAFGLRIQRRRRNEIAGRVSELLDLVGMAGFEERSPVTLSGGERQRVALARALAPEPLLLLLDEPLAALDPELKDRLADDLRAVLARLGTPAVYVTHDRAEATRISDRVVALADLAGAAGSEGTSST